jgi:hypothetical protein
LIIKNLILAFKAKSNFFSPSVKSQILHKVCHSRVRALVSGIKKKELLKVVINIEAEDSNLILATLKSKRLAKPV